MLNFLKIYNPDYYYHHHNYYYCYWARSHRFKGLRCLLIVIVFLDVYPR